MYYEDVQMHLIFSVVYYFVIIALLSRLNKIGLCYVVDNGTKTQKNR